MEEEKEEEAKKTSKNNNNGEDDVDANNHHNDKCDDDNIDENDNWLKASQTNKTSPMSHTSSDNRLTDRQQSLAHLLHSKKAGHEEGHHSSLPHHLFGSSFLLPVHPHHLAAHVHGAMLDDVLHAVGDDEVIEFLPAVQELCPVCDENGDRELVPWCFTPSQLVRLPQVVN